MTTANVDPGIERARALLEVGRAEQAVEHLIRVVTVQPGSVEALCLLALAYGKLGQSAAALAAAEQALALAPNDEWAHRLRADALNGLGRFREAVAEAERAVQLAPSLWQTHVMYAQSLLTPRSELFVRPGIRAAARACRRARELAPNEADVHLISGLVYDRMGDSRAARAAWRRATALDHENSAARHNLAAAHLDSWRPVAAAAMHGAALAAAPTDKDLVRFAPTFARSVLWRIFDLTSLTWLAMYVVALIVLDEIQSQLSLHVVLAAVALSLFAAYVAVVRSVLRRASPATRTLIRANLARPTFALAAIGIIATLVSVAVFGATGGGPLAGAFALPAFFAVLISAIRVRNRILFVAWRFARRAWYGRLNPWREGLQ
jgi:tetratricopeptide (TPR) repeat protein